jgi:hypothetical protein
MTEIKHKFKSGDKAVVSQRFGSEIDLVEVLRVTPAGWVVTASGDTFGADLYERCKGFRRQISPLTPGAEDRLLRQDLLRDIPNTKWNVLPTETLMRIKKLIDGETE